MTRRGASAAAALVSGPAPQPARRRGRFTARLTTARILDELAQVANQVAIATGDEPHRFTASEWDVERQIRLVPGLPTSETICQRLRLSWSVVVKAALLAPAKRAQFLATQGDRNVGRLGPDGPARALEALQAVALELGPSNKLTQFAYDAIVRDLESASRCWRHSDPLRLPRSVYLIAKFGSWAAACAAAGLDPDPGGVEYLSLPSRADVLDDCVTELGYVPPRDYFNRFCQSRLISYSNHKDPWFVTVNEVRERRALRGEDTPLRPSTTPLPLLPAVTVQSAGVLIHTKADVIASLQRYADRYLPAGQAPRQHHYTHCCTADTHLIDAGRMKRYGGFTALCREAGIA
jgi:hypothetical protein